MGDEQDRGPEQQRLLGWIAAAAALLFALTLVAVILVQLLGPALGIDVGEVSDVAIGTLATSVITLTSAVALRDIARRKNGG